MVDQFTKKLIGKASFEFHCIPVLFVHVPAGADFGVFLPQLDGAIRVAFEVDGKFLIIQPGEGEHFTHHFEDKGHFVEGESFLDAFFFYSVVAEELDVH